jgi:hypothetical protein
MNKTQAIFATLTARYGKPQTKEGQEVQAIAISFESALGPYGAADLSAACQQWMASSKYPRWPEPAELLEILRSFGAKPEAKGRIEMSQRTRQAANDASIWYRNLMAEPLPQGAWPNSWQDAVCHVIGAGKAEYRGRSFAWLLTHAWLEGTIPNGFNHKAREYFARMRERRAAYSAAVQEHGALAVHERRVAF